MDNTTRDKNKAEKSLETARGDVAAAKRELGQAQQDKQDRDIELRELLDSRSSKDAVAAAGRLVRSLLVEREPAVIGQPGSPGYRTPSTRLA